MADTWYYSSEGKAVGPHSFDEIKRMAESGRITAGDHVCFDGKTWLPAGEVAGLEFGDAPLNYQGREMAGAMLTPKAVNFLVQTGLWVRIMSVILLVSSGLYALLGVVRFAQGALPHGVPGAAFEGVIYIAMSILLFGVPGVLLSRFAGQIKAFGRLRRERVLEEALQAQKSYWKYTAVLSLVSAGLVLIFVVLGIILAVAGGLPGMAIP